LAESVQRVRISEFKVDRTPARFKITGLGSCVALAFHDPEKRIGGLAHILLPGPAPKMARQDCLSKKNNVSKYADLAVGALLDAMIQAGSAKPNIVAKIVGGANMFAGPTITDEHSPVKPGIGERNVETVKKLLQALELPLAAEDVGGSMGRTILFETQNGQITVSSVRGPKLIL